MNAAVCADARRIEFSVATRADEPDLRRLLRENPMAGEISVAFTREPDALAAGAMSGGPHHTIVARDAANGRPVGMGTRAVYHAFVDGEPCRLGYLSQLRIDRAYRGRVGLLSEGYKLIRSLRGRDELPFDVTTIVADNRPAVRVLEAGRRGVPRYQRLGAFTTVIVPLWRHRRPSSSPGFHIERASPERGDDIAACVERNYRRYQFAPRWPDRGAREWTPPASPRDFFIATAGGRTIGSFALWDQTGFKQIVVDSYGSTMRRLYPWMRLLSKAVGTPVLPPPGACIHYVFGSHIAVDGDRPDVFRALFIDACNDARRRGYACLILGFADRHPFLQVIRRVCRTWTYTSLIYAVCWEGEGAAARIVHGRMPHLEVALL